MPVIDFNLAKRLDEPAEKGGTADEQHDTRDAAGKAGKTTDRFRILNFAEWMASEPDDDEPVVEDDYDDDDEDEGDADIEITHNWELMRARQAASQGILVLPFDPVTQKPLVPVEQATTDSVTITRWWLQWPDALAFCGKKVSAEADGAKADGAKADPDHDQQQQKQSNAKQKGSLTFLDELADVPPKEWIMKGVIAHGETSNWFGPPGSLKSALMTDLAIHVAAKKDWRGFRAKERSGVVYFALERGAQVKRRLGAYIQHRGATADLPIAVNSGIVDLISPNCVDAIVEAIREVEAHYRCRVGLIIIDTISKGLAAGGGDENSAQHTTIMLANLRRVEDRTGVHIACVGHTGKDEGKGHRALLRIWATLT